MNSSDAKIVTFYSYKGGVGRSMAVANVAWLLAERFNYRVLTVDWDLEAPGLHRFFGFRDEDIHTGLLEILEDYKNLMRKDSGSLPEQLVDLHKYVKPVKTFSGGGLISILAAGRQDDSAKYAAAINAFSWEEFYATWHGFGFIEHLKEQLKKFDGTDVVIVDSRTGVTDIGGICTLQLPDTVVILFAMNDQNISGAKAVAEKISKKAQELEGRDTAPTVILRPARVERTTGNQAKKVEWQKRAALKLGMFFDDGEAETTMAKKNIPYVSDFSYGETPLAVEEDRLGDMADSFEDLAQTILRTSEKNGTGGRLAPEQKGSLSNLVRHLSMNARLFLSQRRNRRLAFAFVALLLVALLSLLFQGLYLQKKLAILDTELQATRNSQAQTNELLNQKLLEYARLEERLAQQPEAISDPERLGLNVANNTLQSGQSTIISVEFLDRYGQRVVSDGTRSVEFSSSSGTLSPLQVTVKRGTWSAVTRFTSKGPGEVVVTARSEGLNARTTLIVKP